MKAYHKEYGVPIYTKNHNFRGASRWNSGLTKETDTRIKDSANKLQGSIPWNKGLTKETDKRITLSAQKNKDGWTPEKRKQASAHFSKIATDILLSGKCMPGLKYSKKGYFYSEK